MGSIKRNPCSWVGGQHLGRDILLVLCQSIPSSMDAALNVLFN